MKTSANSRHLFILSLILCLIGLGSFAYRAGIAGYPLTPGETANAWDVEIALQFLATGGPVKASVFLPVSEPPFAILDENFISRGFGLSTSNKGGNRRALWSLRNANGQFTLYYRALLEKTSELNRNPKADYGPPVVAPAIFEEAQLAAAGTLMEDIKSRSADLETQIKQLLLTLKQKDNPLVRSVMGRSRDREAVLTAAVKLLSTDNIPARILHTLRISDQTASQSKEMWLEIHDGRHWISYDPISGDEALLGNTVRLWHGPGQLTEVVGAKLLSSSLMIQRNAQMSKQASIMLDQDRSPGLFELPLDTQNVYRIVVLIPIGILFLVLMRNVIGFKTFGTFMPVLIALSFRETELIAGIIMFLLLIMTGLSARFYLERLHLLMVPRQAAIVMIVVIFMMLVSLLSHRLSIPSGLSVALFPMIIIAMTIERMSIVWEERGAQEAYTQLFGSIAVSSLAFLIMSNDEVEHLMFVFPELCLVLLGFVLVLGRYRGYRLFELFRFRAMAKQP